MNDCLMGLEFEKFFAHRNRTMSGDQKSKLLRETKYSELWLSLPEFGCCGLSYLCVEEGQSDLNES